MITRERVESRAALRALKQPLFDTAIFDNAGVNRLNYFQAPQGNPIVAAGAFKSEVDTNLTQAGQLGRPQEFDLYGFNLEFTCDPDDAGATIADLQLLYDAGVFEFFFGQQRPWLQIPVQEIPNGAGWEGTVATANVGTEYFFAKNGIGDVHSYYVFTIGKKPIPIASAENFTARVDFPQGAVTPSQDYRVRCFMKGVLYAAL